MQFRNLFAMGSLAAALAAPTGVGAQTTLNVVTGSANPTMIVSTTHPVLRFRGNDRVSGSGSMKRLTWIPALRRAAVAAATASALRMTSRPPSVVTSPGRSGTSVA